MIWLRRLLYRRIIKGLEHRIACLEKYMDKAMEHRQTLSKKIEDCETYPHDCEEAIKIYKEELESWTRIYWDAWVRHEEVCSALNWTLKDLER